MTREARGSAPSARQVGVVVMFKPAQGYGFIRPEGADVESAEVYVHVSNIQRRQALRQGQRVAYQVVQSDRGPRAVNVQPGSILTIPTLRFGAVGIGGALLMFFVLMWVFGFPVIPAFWLLLWLAAWSVATFFLYGYDKAQAGSGALRVPERVLLLMPLLGGWPGALLGRSVFHHKTVKRSFQVAFWPIVALWVIALLAMLLLGVRN
jgi:uncharacterized membrane protein YsdA (DUF1294 family)/cold shock CspA family protein